MLLLIVAEQCHSVDNECQTAVPVGLWVQRMEFMSVAANSMSHASTVPAHVLATVQLPACWQPLPQAAHDSCA